MLLLHTITSCLEQLLNQVSAIRTLVQAPNSVYGGGIWTLKPVLSKVWSQKTKKQTKMGIEPATFRLPFGRLDKQGPDWGLGCYNKVPSSSCTGPFLNNRVRSRIEPRPFRDLRANGWVPLTLKIKQHLNHSFISG